MTANQFRAVLDRLNISQGKAAKLCGVDPRTARRWALGERTIPGPAVILLRLLASGKVSVKDVEVAHER